MLTMKMLMYLNLVGNVCGVHILDVCFHAIVLIAQSTAEADGKIITKTKVLEKLIFQTDDCSTVKVNRSPALSQLLLRGAHECLHQIY